MNELSAIMLVRTHVPGLTFGKFRQVSRNALFGSSKGEHLEEESGNGTAGNVGEAQAVAGANDREGPSRSLIGKEVLQTDVENHRNARQRG